MHRQPRLRPWVALALGLVVFAAGLLGWWNASRARDATQERPGRGEAASGPAGPGGNGPRRVEAGAAVHPRPVILGTEAAAGIMMVRGDRLLYVAGDGAVTEVFRLPEGHVWAGAVAPSPSAGAVAFVTRAEAGTGYLWVLRSDLEFSPYPLPDAIKVPRSVAWAGDEAVLVGDPPHLFLTGPERWRRLPGDALVRPGPPSPGGGRVVYGAREGRAGAGPYRLYAYDLQRGSARAIATGDAVPHPGPWVDEDRLLVGLGDPPAATAVAAVRELALLDTDRQVLRKLVRAPRGGGGWLVLGISPDRKWAVVAPAPSSGRPGGAWRLIDLQRLTSRQLPVADTVLDASWSAEDNRLYYLRPAGPRPEGNQAVEVVALTVPAAGARVVGSIDPSPARITRLLGTEAGRLWLELQTGAGAPELALWDAATGRLIPVSGK
ncbi:MAG TPA: hypothetical protein VIK92_09320 [Thermaerobacter sp.]